MLSTVVVPRRPPSGLPARNRVRSSRSRSPPPPRALGHERCTEHDPCGDVAHEAWERLKILENKPHVFCTDIETAHPQLGFRSRRILVDWMSELAHELKLQRRTFFAAVNFLDRSIAQCVALPRERFQLLGMACLLISDKLEETDGPDTNRYAGYADGAYSVRQLVETEKLVLTSLGYDLTVATASDFLERYMHMVLCSDKTRRLAQMLLELTAASRHWHGHKPSAWAASALWLAMAVRFGEKNAEWTPALKDASGYNLVHLIPAIKTMNAVFKCAHDAKTTKEKHVGIFDVYQEESTIRPIVLKLTQ